MNRVLLGLGVAAAAASLLVAAGCASLATPEAAGSGSPSPATGATVSASQQVKDGAQLYVDLACIRCHAPDGVGGIPNRLNVGGDSTIPPLNNTYRDTSEQFTNPQQITQIIDEGGILSKKPGVINMPSWKGVINSAQADAIAAYILAGFPHVGATYDPDPAKAPAIYATYACIGCHGQVGQEGAPNPLTADKSVPGLRNPDDNVPLSELRSVLMEGSIPDPGTKGVIFMPAWGQILSMDQLNTILPYIQDGPKAKSLPAPPAATPLPLAGGAAASASPTASGAP
ncbi:MAG: c-type cytochrome [Actinobacteria bacterium]|nr:c-type cytochrome [Actinomycetota bacterium]